MLVIVLVNDRSSDYERVCVSATNRSEESGSISIIKS